MIRWARKRCNSFGVLIMLVIVMVVVLFSCKSFTLRRSVPVSKSAVVSSSSHTKHYQQAAKQHSDYHAAAKQHSDYQQAAKQHSGRADYHEAAKQHSDYQQAAKQHSDSQEAAKQHTDYQQAAKQHSDSQEAAKQHSDVCEKYRKADVVHVATAGDKNRLAAMVTLATSVIVNTNSTVMWHFITFDTQVEMIRDVMESSIVRNTAYEIIPFSNETLQGQFVVRSPRQELANPLNFVRFYLPALLPCLDRIAYMDVDCLVVGDIRKLYDWPIMDKHVIALMPETMKYAHTALNFSHPVIRNMTIKRTTLIMSAGVFVANLTRWRTRNITAQLDYWMKLNVRTPVVKYSLTGPGSQAMFLLALFDKYTPLDKAWNKVVAYQSNHEPQKDSNLLHWSGPRKPWSTNNVKNAAVWRKYFVMANSSLTRVPKQRE